MKLLLALCIAIVAAMTPEEEACAAPLMKQLANEKDVETKKFVMKCFKMMNAGKRDEVHAAVKKFDKEKLAKFMDGYLVGPCAMFRAEFDGFLAA